ncbi:MAG: hypothetical protein ACI4RA_08975 [Kiritimatiellia bacterium]
MTDEERYGGYTPGRATRFYIPLMLQAFSQSLTYPLVAGIAAHGEFGEGTYAAFAQGQTIMFMIGALGGGLVMTGMVFARTLAGFRAFVRVNTWMMIALLLAQTLLAVPPFDALIFRRYLGLAPHLVETARWTLFWGFVMQGAFFLRNVPLVVLFNNRESGLATLATAVRILLTIGASAAFLPLGLVGAGWALVATTIPCIVELLLSHVFARRYVRRLRDSAAGDAADDAPCDAPRQFRFTLPLSLGGFLLATAPSVIAAFVNRTADGISMLAIHYATIGFANPVGYAAFRMQAVAIQFPPEYAGDRRVVRYAACAGLVLGLVPLVIALPGVGDWLFLNFMNLQPQNIRPARVVMCCYAAWPVFQCVRGYFEGHAAWLKHPTAVLVGQLVYLTGLTATLALAFALGAPGWIMGFAAVFCATLATIAALVRSLRAFKAQL